MSKSIQVRPESQSGTSISGGSRRQYDSAFKQEAIRLSDSGRSVREVAFGLGISEQLLHNWRSKRKGQLDDESRSQLHELELLRKQLRQTEMERDILKKALAYFSRTTP